MDILDNIMFASFFRQLTGSRPIESDYIANPATFPLPVISNPATPLVPVYNYTLGNKLGYCIVDDPQFIEKGILRHWFDVNEKAIYAGPGSTPQYSSFLYTSNYHMIYGYLIENTRILQIFEKVIDKYLNDEELGIADNFSTFNWIQNSERLFFKSDVPKQTNLRSILRPNSDNSRRNAYFRMFGMDLAFGDIDPQNASKPYIKARASNQQFIVLFERYLSEIWQGFINAKNTSGANTADVNILVELAQEIREILIARRGSVAATSYGRLNLSKEEYSSVLMNSWFSFIVSYNSPIVNYLNAQSSTVGERLMKIGTKVGIPAHSKCQALFDMAGSAANILLAVEANGLLDDPNWVQQMLTSFQGPATLLNATQRKFMDDFLTVINNWEKATGHRIKNPEANIRGTVKISSNGAPAPVKPRTQLN
ncbi:hypothetical protein A4H97_10680 [Niastella yeongjuensis]|uniref:Uncharacterized protein n=1 Tax=Niastella yeongjuensis TaxID=354355 RepID=A0A1V9EFB0_9BACT|nr:hypothetical protein [Niastella yeongjuensis]OQP44818.1 hypothetical protein A4H97_10680 [Niastella yeongjuensis]SEP42216.1 hypothetical protein SAMN05660816_05962 [Niastella yeongjuensis]